MRIALICLVTMSAAWSADTVLREPHMAIDGAAMRVDAERCLQIAEQIARSAARDRIAAQTAEQRIEQKTSASAVVARNAIERESAIRDAYATMLVFAKQFTLHHHDAAWRQRTAAELDRQLALMPSLPLVAPAESLK